MDQKDFLRLFMETGEPIYWLLSRAENLSCTPQAFQSRTAGKKTFTPPAPQ